MEPYVLLMVILTWMNPSDQPPIVMSVRVDQTFTIQLPSSIGTGFTWQLADSVDATRIRLLSKQYKESASPAEPDGQPGTDVFTFKALQKGQIALRLQYVRPWLKSIPPDTSYQSVRITIH